MAPPNSTYRFSSLDTGSNQSQIRLLHLAPGNPDEPLCGRLVHVELRSEAYEALSYEWGSSEKNHAFHLGAGQTLYITESLHNALCDLRPKRGRWPRWLNRVGKRQKAKVRVVWADGICINQDDINERGRQVAMMGDIYRNATRVITYIGSESNGSTNAIAFARLLQSQAHLWQGDTRRLAEAEQELAALDPKWVALRSLLARGWASRCWCAVEFLLNRNLVVVCGGVELPDWYLLPVATHMVFNRILPVSLLPKPGEDPRGVAECHSHLLTLRSSIQHTDTRPAFVDLLRNFHPFQASDPRDKVYALLGLASDAAELAIPLDYSTPAEEVYTFTVRRIIATSPPPSSINILYDNLPHKSLSLPSWVPDWSTWAYGSAGIAYDGTYTAGGPATTADLHIHSSDEGRLEVSGCLVDRIVKLSDSPIGPHYHTFEPVRNLTRDAWLKEQQALVEAIMPYLDGRWESRDVLWRTLTGDQTFNRTRAHGQCREGFNAHFEYDEVNSDGREELAREFVDAVRRKSRSRALAVTEKRYLGAVPETARVGDVVCMFHGAGQLFVVREVEGRNGCFEYVGSAYVHGLMYGEVLKAKWYKECVISLV